MVSVFIIIRRKSNGPVQIPIDNKQPIGPSIETVTILSNTASPKQRSPWKHCHKSHSGIHQKNKKSHSGSVSIIILMILFLVGLGFEWLGSSMTTLEFGLHDGIQTTLNFSFHYPYDNEMNILILYLCIYICKLFLIHYLLYSTFDFSLIGI